MKLMKSLSVAALSFILTTFAGAADLAGKWTSEFETQIGHQKYLYEFKADGDKLSGKASFERPMGKGETPLKDVKVSGDDVSFIEMVRFEDMDITITYKGKIKDDELNLTRTVGDFATEQIVAKRVKTAPAAAAKP